MLKIALGIFLIAHGLVHSGLAFAPNPDDPDETPGAFFTSLDRSWLLPQLGSNAATVRWIGIALVVLSTVGFILAGLGFLGVPGLDAVWRTLALVASFISLLLLVLYWHRWLPVGVLIDIGVITSL